MQPPDPTRPLRIGALDADTAALLWLLVEGGVPLVVAGPSGGADRLRLATDLLTTDPSRAIVVLDADAEPITTERLAALLRGGVARGVTLAAPDLEAVLDRLAAAGLPEDGVRRMGVVVILAETAAGLRCTSVHYLRPTERDGQGHLQRRPPAVLAAWDEDADTFEDYAWGITPELADRVDRSQADLEERRASRAAFLHEASADPDSDDRRFADFLATEPPAVPAPEHEPARPSPFSSGLLEPDDHVH
jgi:hypothetical protein